MWACSTRLAFHVPAARTSSRHVLDWLRKPFCGGPHWLHQDRIQFWLDADGGRSWDYPDSEEDSEDYNTDGSDDLDLPERLRPSVAEMARGPRGALPSPYLKRSRDPAGTRVRKVRVCQCGPQTPC